MQQNDLKEGAILRGITLAADYAYSVRIAKILYQDWSSTDAFKLGIIDAKGNKLKNPTNLAERAAYSPFLKLIFAIKKLISKVPGSSSKIAAVAAAYVMLKEHAVYEDGILPEVLDEVFEAVMLDMNVLCEDGEGAVAGAPVMTASALPSQPVPLGIARKKWREIPKVAGKHTFEVEHDLFDRVKTAKIKGERWSKYVKPEDGEVGQNILKFAKTYPSKPIVLKRGKLDVYTHLKD